MTVVLFRVDASPTIGGGHAMRCLALAEALRAKGAECHFAAGTLTPALAEQIGRDFPLHRFDAAADPGAGGADWDRTPWPVAAQDADREAFEAIRAALGAQTVVIDHYRLDASFSAPLAAKGVQIAVIDDLANRVQNCAFLVDHNLGRRRRDYAGLVPAGARVMCGPRFALLRPEFARHREAALVRRRSSLGGRVLVSLGTTDPDAITGDIVAALSASTAPTWIDVVLADTAPSVDSVRTLARSDPRIRLLGGVSNMAELMLAADVAVGAAGTTSWERCVLGLSSVILVLAGNQQHIAAALSHAGAAITASNARTAAIAACVLVENTAARRAMARAAFEVTDGLGVGRVAAAIHGSAETERSR